MSRYTIIICLVMLNCPYSEGQTIYDCKSLENKIFSSDNSRSDRTISENIEIFSNYLLETEYVKECDYLKSTLCRILAYDYWDLGKYNRADSLCEIALNVDNKLEDQIGIAKTLGLRTGLAQANGNPLKGIKYSEKAIKILEQIVKEEPEVEILINQILLNKASCLRNLYRNHEAKQIYSKLSKGESGVSLEVALQGLGDISHDQSVFDSAIYYYKQLYPFYQDDLNLLAHLDHSVGTAYVGLKDTTNARFFFTKSKSKAKQINNNSIHLLSLIDLFSIGKGNNLVDSMAQYKKELLELLKNSKDNIGDQEDQLAILITLANDFVNENKNVESLRLIKDYSKDVHFPAFYSKVKKKVQAEEFSRLAWYFISVLMAVIIFLVFAREKERAITEERFKKEAAKQEKEVLKIQMEKELLVKEKEKQVLREKNVLLELDHTEELLKTEYDLRMHHAILAHDLKGEATGIRNGLHGIVEFYDKHPVKKSELQSLYQNAALLSTDVKRLSQGLEPNPKEWLVKLERMLQRLEKDTSIKTTIKAPNIMDATLTPFIGHRVFTILRVLVDNVREHSKASKLEITTLQEEDLLTITVEDDGQGGFTFPDDVGVGLTSVIKRIKSLNGQLVVDTDKKTKFTLKIPLVTTKQ